MSDVKKRSLISRIFFQDPVPKKSNVSANAAPAMTESLPPIPQNPVGLPPLPQNTEAAPPVAQETEVLTDDPGRTEILSADPGHTEVLGEAEMIPEPEAATEPAPTPAPSQMTNKKFCDKCGTPNTGGGKFCPGCGSNLEVSA